MKRIVALIGALAVPLTAFAAPKKEAPAKLEVMILEAPGPIGCYTDVRPIRLVDCEEREAAVAAFKKLVKTDKKRAYAAVEKRFAEIPSAKGGYLPILLSVVSGDKHFVAHLQALQQKQPKSELAKMAAIAEQRLTTGACAEDTPKHYAELCMPAL